MSAMTGNQYPILGYSMLGCDHRPHAEVETVKVPLFGGVRPVFGAAQGSESEGRFDASSGS